MTCHVLLLGLLASGLLSPAVVRAHGGGPSPAPAGSSRRVFVEGSLLGSVDRRYSIAADESGLTILNLAAVGLQSTAAGVLRDMASHHPEKLQAAQNLGQVVENIARTDVAEIHALPKPFWSSIHRHARIGLGVGAAIGLVAGLASAGGDCGSSCVPAVAFRGSLMGAEIGAIKGAVLGATTGRIQHVIYRAP